MGKTMTDNTLELWDEAEVTQGDGCDVGQPWPPDTLWGYGLPNQGIKWPAGILWWPAGGEKYTRIMNKGGKRLLRNRRNARTQEKRRGRAPGRRRESCGTQANLQAPGPPLFKTVA